jgi:protein-disulfide isomerase
VAAKVRGRHLFQIILLVLLGLGVGQILRHAVPIGRDLGDNATMRAVLRDRTYPSQEAPVSTLTLIVFTDYRCPACRRADPEMEAAIAKDGHVRVIYRDWPIFGPLSEHAARIAIAADSQGIYSALHARLMREPRTLDDPVLRELVARSGGNWTKLQADLKTHRGEIEAQLANTRTVVFSLGIAGTPAYLAGPVLAMGANDATDFANLFAEGRKAGEASR